MRRLRNRNFKTESISSIVDKLLREDNSAKPRSYVGMDKVFYLSELSNYSGFNTIVNAYDGDIDDLSKHSYGHTYNIEGDRLFVIYSNFGASHKISAEETIGDGKGAAIAKELAFDDRDYVTNFINSHFPGYKLRTFDRENSPGLIQEANNAIWVIHVDQNGRILN